MRYCSLCKLSKEIDGFYSDKSRRDGWSNKCKECSKSYSKTDRAKAYRKRYQQTEKYKIAKKKYLSTTRAKELARAYSRLRWADGRTDREKNRETCRKFKKTTKGRAMQARDRARNKLLNRDKVYLAVHSAIRSKRLIKKPCEVCGALKAHAHHEDYSRPLDVQWLCVNHHAEHHKQREQKA